MKTLFALPALLLALSSSITATDPEGTMPDDQQLLLVYGGTVAAGCDNPLDEARVLVSVADFLDAYTLNDGMLPDIQTLASGQEGTCTGGYRWCDKSLGGGCCSGFTCKVTSNGLERCVEPSYTALPTEIDGDCTRGQSCAEGLECQPDVDTIGSEEPQSVCLPPSSATRHLRSKTTQIAIPNKLGLKEKLLEIQERKLYYVPGWCQYGRTCGRCHYNEFFDGSKSQQKNDAKYCNKLCMLSCGRRRLNSLDDDAMANLMAALVAYMHLLDFGDDCMAGAMEWTWAIGAPGDE